MCHQKENFQQDGCKNFWGLVGILLEGWLRYQDVNPGFTLLGKEADAVWKKKLLELSQELKKEKLFGVVAGIMRNMQNTEHKST